MGRPPTARQKVIDASRRIVKERGAGALTYDEIAHESGVTRGGITYHFPTKQRLLQALVEQDIEQWRTVEVEHRPDDCPAEAAELIGVLRTFTAAEPERRRFVAGMLGAATLDPPVIDAAREYERERLEGVEWDARNVRLQILRMAAGGIFWADLFGCPELPAELRDKLVEMIEALAVEWSAVDDTTNNKEEER